MRIVAVEAFPFADRLMDCFCTRMVFFAAVALIAQIIDSRFFLYRKRLLRISREVTNGARLILNRLMHFPSQQGFLL